MENKYLVINQIFNMFHKIVADIDYVQGYLRYGHYELILNDEEFEKFKSLSENDQEEEIRDNGNLMIDSYSVDDIGSITEINY